MAIWKLGPLRLTSSLARRLALAGGAAALAGGLALGVATAADPGDHVQAPPAVRGPARLVLPLIHLRQPLHQRIIARLRGETAGERAAAPQLLVGRIVQLGGNGALVVIGPRETVQVRVTAQTRLPGRRPAPGDRIVVVGRPAEGGTFVARAVLLVPARNARRAP